MARIVIKALWCIGSEGWGGMRGHNSTEEISFLGYSRISASMVWL